MRINEVVWEGAKHALSRARAVLLNVPSGFVCIFDVNCYKLARCAFGGSVRLNGIPHCALLLYFLAKFKEAGSW